MATFTLTGKANDLVGDGPTRTMRGYVEPSQPVINDAATNTQHYGNKALLFDEAGGWTIDLIETGDLVAAYRVVIEYVDDTPGSTAKLQRKTSNYFTLTDDTEFGSKVDVDVTAVTTETLESVYDARDEALGSAEDAAVAQAAAEAAAATAGQLATSDGQTATNVVSGSLTTRAVRQRIGRRGSTYNITDSSMAAWNRAQVRALIAGVPATMLGKGNSIMQNTNTAPFNVSAWMSRVQKKYEQRFGYTGEFITLMDVTSQDTRYSKTGTWATLTNKGWVASRAATTTTVGSTAVFTGKYDRITVYCLKTSDGGTAAYSGFGTGTVDCSGTEAVVSFTATGTLGGANTLTITAPTDGTRLTILGAHMRVGTTGGTTFIKAAYTGQKTQNFTANTSAGDPLKVARNVAVPDLTVIDLITNDYGTGTVTPLATHEANMRTLIASGLETGSVVLVIPPTPRVRVGPDGAADTADDIPLTTSPTFADFVNLSYSLADEYNIGLVDIAQRWGGTWASADALGFMSDYYHPSNLGNADYATAIFEAVFGTAPGRDPITTDVPNVFTATQTIGHPSATTSRVRIGSGDVVTDYSGTPALASVLASTTGALILAAKSGQSIQLYSDQLLIAGKKHNGQNANVPAIDVNTGFIRMAGVATGSRPAAATAGKGAQHFDTTLNRPIWSTGAAWVDAMGTAV